MQRLIHFVAEGTKYYHRRIVVVAALKRRRIETARALAPEIVKIASTLAGCHLPLRIRDPTDYVVSVLEAAGSSASDADILEVRSGRPGF